MLKRIDSRTLRAVHQRCILTGCLFTLALSVYLALHLYSLYRRADFAADEWQHLWLVDGPAAGWRELIYMPALLVSLWVWRPGDSQFSYKAVSQSDRAVEAEGVSSEDGDRDEDRNRREES